MNIMEVAKDMPAVREAFPYSIRCPELHETETIGQKSLCAFLTE